jgi:Alpha/beta hydrolase domain
MVGSFIPFPKNAAEAAAAHDPRKPLAERYPDRDAYQAALRASARKLVEQRFLLAGDVDAVVAQAANTWDFAAEAR